MLYSLHTCSHLRFHLCVYCLVHAVEQPLLSSSVIFWNAGAAVALITWSLLLRGQHRSGISAPALQYLLFSVCSLFRLHCGSGPIFDISTRLFCNGGPKEARAEHWEYTGTGVFILKDQLSIISTDLTNVLRIREKTCLRQGVFLGIRESKITWK